MPSPLFGIDIPGIVNDSLPGMFAGVLTSKTPGARTGGNSGAGTNPTSVAYSFKGFAEVAVVSQDQVRVGTHTVYIVAQSLVVAATRAKAAASFGPKPGDTIVLTGDPFLAGKTAVIVEAGVKRDPAGAMWICQVKA